MNDPTFSQNFSKQPAKNLRSHEWMAVSFLMSVLLLLTITSHSCIANTLPETENHVHSIVKAEIEVSITGDVELPGKYFVKRGTKVKDLVELAKPKSTADLRQVKWDATLKKGSVVKIPVLQMIKIILKFESGVEEELAVIKGTKLEDLLLIYSFNEDVNLQKLQKKRRLKDGEVVKIFSNGWF